MPMINRIDKSLIDEKTFNLLASVIFSMRQVKNRYDAIEKEVCSHYVSPNHVVSLGWDMIDWSERLRKLLHVGRGFKKKDVWCQSILNDLKDLEDVRHFTQHFDREVGKSDQSYLDLMGSLRVKLNRKYYPHKRSWTFSIDNSIDLQILQRQNRTFDYDMLQMSGRIVESATLSLAGADVDLDQLRSKVGHAKHGLDDYLVKYYYEPSQSGGATGPSLADMVNAAKGSSDG